METKFEIELRLLKERKSKYNILILKAIYQFLCTFRSSSLDYSVIIEDYKHYVFFRLPSAISQSIFTDFL